MRPIPAANFVTTFAAPFAMAFAITGLLLATPAAAATKEQIEQKQKTCEFGADHDKLTGKKRDAFIKKCMSNANYEPAARIDAMKKMPPKKKPAAMNKPAMNEPATTDPAMKPDDKKM